MDKKKMEYALYKQPIEYSNRHHKETISDSGDQSCILLLQRQFSGQEVRQIIMKTEKRT